MAVLPTWRRFHINLDTKLDEKVDGKGRAHSFSLDVDTMYSARAGCGFHWTSATSQVPPCGKNRGTSSGASRSIINRPLLLSKDENSDISHDGKDMDSRSENHIPAGGAYTHLRGIPYISFDRHIGRREIEGI